jgi:hypothetical protein
VQAPTKKEKGEGKLKDIKDEGKRDKRKKKRKMVLCEFQEALKYPKSHVKHMLMALSSCSLLQ